MSTYDAGQVLLNEACVFLKPHADNDACELLLRSMLEAAGATIVSTHRIVGDDINKKRLIDLHYGSLAEAAMVISPESLVVGAEKEAAFEEMFGIAWNKARKICNPEQPLSGSKIVSEP